MRSRFLNTDYFSTPPSLVFETLGFLNLPVPDNFPAPVVCHGEDIFLRFGSAKDFSLPIENLPIEAALSKFLSDVVPNRVSVDYGVFEMDDSSSDELKLLGYEDSEFLEKKDGDATEEKSSLNFNIIQFETPELDSEMEERLSSKGDDLQCFSEVLQITNEPVKFEDSDIILQNSNDIQQNISSVDYVSSDYFTENTTSITEDECFRKNRTWFRNARFPLLEVDEVNLSALPSLSIFDKAVTVLETTKPQDTNALSSLIVNSTELLVSKDYDLLGILSTDIYSNTCAQFDMVPEGSEIDIVTILEASSSEENFQFEQGKVAVDYDFSMVPVTFEEFQILDVEITGVFDIFLCLQKAIEPEICYGMFSEEMNFKNFDELVVSSELAFTDDAFKSLPTPLLHDYEMTRSLDLIYEDVLSEIKLQSFPVSNDIYLPWNLLEETNHSPDVPFCDYPVEEIVTCDIDYNLESLEGEKWVYDFIFSEDSFCEPLEEGCTEHFYGISTLDEHPPVNTSHGLLKNPSPKARGVNDNAKKAMLVFKSMSAFDDLNFFMDPKKAVTEENLESRVEAAMTANLEYRVEAATTNLESRVEVAKAAKGNDSKSCSSSENTKESEFVSMAQDSGRKSGIIEQGVHSDQKAVIVVNAKTVDKEMIISRRSTYQKVLAMEKEGMQVVERDSDLPVDLMLSSAICLLWYECENASKKPAAAIDASSSSLSWIGDIATNVLTSLSFSFSSCIMIFEGKSACLAAVMESSDELYAAAGSLGISLQIFCSTSAELTDEIILRCIKSSVVLSQVHDKMPESESLAESFLTKFPSVNPLTAQAILLSAGSLLEFMKLPLSNKIQRMEKYHAPEESIDLFSSLCKYGAREDSKSVMTDSSSSVSSGPDSDTHHFSAHSDSKRKQHITWENKIDMDDLVHFAPSTEFVDAKLNPSGDFQIDDSWSSKDHEIFHFDPITDFSSATLKPSGIINPNDSWPSKDPESFNKKSGPGSSSKDTFWEQDFEGEDNLPGFESWNLPVTGEYMSQSRGHKFSVMGNLNLCDTRSLESFTPDYKGDVINIAGSKFLEQDFLPSPGYKRYARVVSDVDEDVLPRKSKFARKLSFCEPPLQPNFPKAAEINSRPERIATDSNASLRGYVDNFPAKRQRTLLEEVLTRRSAASTTELPFREEISHFGGSPLSTAIQSANQVQGSPWTMEFLNRVRERSRERQQQQQSLPSVLTPSSLKTPSKLKKANTKRKSTSILEFFKYKGGNGRSKLPKEKMQRQSENSSASPTNERFYSPLKSWTPIDKRAKQSLSFTMNGTGSQTKLVWK